MTVTERVEERLDPAVSGDVRRVWQAYAVSEVGSAVGNGALPLVALLVLHADALQVALLGGLGGVAAAVLVLPLGPWLEFRRKRPVMVGVDLVRFAALSSVPLAVWLGALSYVQLLAVAVVTSGGAVLFQAASGSHLKAMLPPARRLRWLGRTDATLWTATTLGTPIGGVLVSAVGAAASMAVDAVSYLLSALRLRGLRTSEPPAAVRASGASRWADTVAGFRHLAGHRGLRALWLNATLFGAGVMLGGPLLPVLLLRDLDLPSWSYGVAIGLAGVGGVLGALSARRAVVLLGERRLLLGAGTLRALWPVALAFAPRGPAGFAVVAGAELGLMFSAGIFNPAFAAYRMRETPDHQMARVLTAWSVSQRVAQPAGMLLGGVVASVTGTRAALGVGGLLVLLGVLALPWRRTETAATAPSTRGAPPS